jgi:Ca2+-binding RTX toxin-like protein
MTPARPVCVVLASAVLAGVPAAARASTVDALGGVSFTASAGESNDVTVTQDDAGVVTVRDDGAALTAQTGCSSTGAHSATCKPMLGATPVLTADLGDGDDRVDMTGLGSAGTIVRARAGDDSIIGSPGSDQIDGGEGADRLDGRAGADRLNGGDGMDVADYAARRSDLRLVLDGAPVSGDSTDGAPGARDRIDPSVEELWSGSGDDVLTGSDGINVLDGGQGADTVSGGGGEDVADYSSRTDAVRVVLGGKPVSGNADDGPAGARDTVNTDVEDVWTGRGDDTLVGNDRNNLLNGGPGADDLQGGAGEDAADYSERATGVVALASGKPESGNVDDGPEGARDTIGADVEDLLGGAGDDSLTGGAGSNWLGGGPGNDVLDARGPGADYSSCGDGADVGWVDPSDIAASDCERIGAGPEQAGGGPGARDRSPAQVRVRLGHGQTLRTAPKGLIVLFTCSESCSVTARLTLLSTSRGSLRGAARPVVNAAGALEHAGGGSMTFTLGARPARLLRRSVRADLSLLLSAKDGARNVTRVRRHLQLLPTKARLAAPKQSARSPFHSPRPPRKPFRRR